MAQYLMNHSVKEYIEKYKRQLDYSQIVYDDIVDDSDKSTKKVNDLMYFKCLIDIIEIQKMKSYGDFGYCKYMAHLFGFYDEEKGYTYRLIEEEHEKESLEEYLDSIVGKKLFKEEQKELINKINLKDGRERIQKSINLLNTYFKENKISYLIVSKTSSQKINGKKRSIRYWEVLNNISFD